MKEEKKTLILTLVAVVTLILCVVGATYAYFQAQTGAGVSANINANTATTDSLKFDPGKTLSITANQDNFKEGEGNRSDDTTVSATLKANNTTNSATYSYNVYFDILSNDFEYTTEEKTAELILQIIGPDDKEVKTISGLNYVTIGNVSGFDITEASNLITIASNYEIHAEAATPTAEKTDEWEITLVLVNLESNQNANTGKTFTAKVIIQQEEIVSLTLAEHIISTYGTDNTLYYHDENLENGAGDNSYRYAGASNNVKNFVCFGSDDATCPTDNLYRIIGVFGSQVKLIKNTSIGNDYWTGSYNNRSNIWENSSLNLETLNSTYLNGLGTTWNNKIATTNWKTGGPTDSQVNTPKQYYDAEVGTSSLDITFDAKIGLMYGSDYGFATSQENWTTKLNDPSNSLDYRQEEVRENNWLYTGLGEWTISPASNFNDYVFAINDLGNVDISFLTAHITLDARPVFYLNSNVTLSSGSGTQSNPYRIEI